MDTQWGNKSKNVCRLCGLVYDPVTTHICPLPGTGPHAVCQHCWRWYDTGLCHICAPPEKPDADKPPPHHESDLRKMASLLTQTVAELVYVREHATDRVQEHARRALRRVDEVTAILGRLERK